MNQRRLGPWKALLGALAMNVMVSMVMAATGSIEGTWGGERLRLVIDAKGAGRIELDCAAGEIAGPIVPGEKGTFAAAGTFEQFRSGPQRGDAAAAPTKARYEGTVEGDTMTLSIWPEGASSAQVFKLRKGATVKLVRCL